MARLGRADRRAARRAGEAVVEVGRRRARRVEQARVRAVAAELPAGLKALRGKLMIEPLVQQTGVPERRCPVCEGSGWLDAVALERCPVCIGFGEVPSELAAHVRAALGTSLGYGEA